MNKKLNGFAIVFVLCISGLPTYCQDLNILTADPLAFSFPCADDPKTFVMSHIVQEHSNNWDGIFFMEKYQNIFNVRLQMVLENEAQVSLKNTLGNVLTNDNRTFVISTFKTPPEIRRIEFRVRGSPLGFFPHLISLRFNDDPLCDNSNRDLSAPFLKKSEKCGKALAGTHQGLISNAADASPGAWPWHVAIYHKDGDDIMYKCGGTLVNSNTVLTAGHCMFHTRTGGFLPADRYILHLGKHNLKVNDENTKELKVRRAILHEGYYQQTLSNDIGILKLESNVVYTKFIQPICLWDEEPGRDIIYKTGKVVGWGYTELGNIPADILREASMPVIEFAECLASNRKVFGEFLSGTNYCAGYRNGTSVCSGDSGSGMYVETNGFWRIRGLVSLGVKYSEDEKSTCNPKDYVLFTDVLRYITWIKEKMK